MISEKELYKKYPKFFVQRGLSAQETAMCFGCECGNGWLDIIDLACGLIDCHLENCKRNNVEIEFQFTQIKEKFGGLRMYYYGGDDYIQGVISFAEYLSETICENCGTNQDVKQTQGWIVTLCPSCMKKREERYK